MKTGAPTNLIYAIEYELILYENFVRRQKFSKHMLLFYVENLCKNVIFDFFKISSFMLGFPDKNIGSHNIYKNQLCYHQQRRIHCPYERKIVPMTVRQLIDNLSVLKKVSDKQISTDSPELKSEYSIGYLQQGNSLQTKQAICKR